MLQDLWFEIQERAEETSLRLRALWRLICLKWQSIFIVIWLLALLVFGAWVGWSLASLEPQCDGHWHHVTVPITVQGTPGTEEKWVCQ